jgi:predicted metal-dependent HD superfamily phosphohydrolase
VDAADREGLREGWQDVVEELGGDWDSAGEVFDDLARRYSEPNRCYHTLDHIWQVFDVAFGLQSGLPPALIFAIFLHDVVYDTHASDNEERSAEYAHMMLVRLGISREVRDETARLILLTRNHETVADDTAGKVLLDADLAILGADEADYDAYAAAIRQEYAWVSDDDYRKGRRAVLERFLARPRLYFSPAMKETQARANLAREIARL